jgi:hypothetical protein
MNKTLLVIGAAVIAYVGLNFTAVRMDLNKMMNSGELAGVEQCVSLSKSSLVAEETIRNACVEDFHVRLFESELAVGRAGPQERSGAVYWEGRVSNNTSEYVTTWGELGVNLFDAQGEKTEVKVNLSLWIEPQTEQEISAELRDVNPEDFEGYEFCDYDEEEETFRSCLTWRWAQIKGLKI